jgi:hypothetical protein
MGLRVASDQRNAMKFLRKHLAVEFARRSAGGLEFELQKQPHDSGCGKRTGCAGRLKNPVSTY